MLTRVSDLARLLNEPDHVIRYWSDYFRIRPTRSKGGQRHFGDRQTARMLKVHRLLRQELFTMEGARRQLGKEEDEQGFCTRAQGPGMPCQGAG